MGLLEDADAITALVLCGRDRIDVRLGARGSEADITQEYEGTDCARAKVQVAAQLSSAGFHPTGEWEIGQPSSDDDGTAWVRWFERR